MAKRILGIVLVLAVLAVAVMAILESRSRVYPMIDSPVVAPVIVQPDSTIMARPADLPDSLR